MDIYKEAISKLFSDYLMMERKSKGFDLMIEYLEEMGEHISFSKDKGKWWVHGNEWSVNDKSFPMAIHLAYIKWKEGKEK